ncbi:hypothetical protein J7I98_19880 [Streptomyces sp. ISL-98]|uniref:hypothetical protein n=1 Tax=Streptomyces sp. ISL-98 TaxID=2819192 RepID=UPI001BE62BBD|nr:hypothetical protein [Streptomyces sp. ISL-98]MBT2508105.1 hypothetical protein [Streptomyces sp. ISL-98]
MVLFGAACAAPQSQQLKDVLPEGWKQEPLIEGADSAVSAVSPKACTPLYEALDGASASGEGQGFRNAAGTYLFARDVKDEGLAAVVDKAGNGCSTMRMRYDSAQIVYRVQREAGEGTVLRLTATDDGGQQIAHMLVGVKSGPGSTRLVRVLNSESSLTKADSDALRLALDPAIAL